MPLSITQETAKVALGLLPCLYLDSLSAHEDQHGVHGLTNRDFVRLCFFEIGIEVEFSGKGINEKGVVIDIDEERTDALNINADTLRFGQTIVRINPQYFNQNDENAPNHNAQPQEDAKYDIEYFVKEEMNKALKTLQSNNN